MALCTTDLPRRDQKNSLGHFQVFPAKLFPASYEIYIIVNPMRKPGTSLYFKDQLQAEY